MVIRPLNLMLKHQTEKPPTLKEASMGREFPEALELIVAKTLEKNPDQRYQSLIDLAEDLTISKRAQTDSTANVTLSRTVPHFLRTSPAAEKSFPKALIGTVSLACLAIGFGVGAAVGFNLMPKPKPVVVEKYIHAERRRARLAARRAARWRSGRRRPAARPAAVPAGRRSCCGLLGFDAEQRAAGAVTPGGSRCRPGWGSKPDALTKARVRLSSLSMILAKLRLGHKPDRQRRLAAGRECRMHAVPVSSVVGSSGVGSSSQFGS